jgi:hypothetical protein
MAAITIERLIRDIERIGTPPDAATIAACENRRRDSYWVFGARA